MLEGAVDIYLPDYKYIDPNMAAMLSGARHYAHAAIDDNGAPDGRARLRSGRHDARTLIRHLVLPGLTGTAFGFWKSATIFRAFRFR